MKNNRFLYPYHHNIIRPKQWNCIPNNELKEPVQRFEDTFSAENVVLDAFFTKNKDL